MTRLIAPLSKSTSTIIFSYISIFSNPIFTVTSLKRFLFKSLDKNISLSSTLSIVMLQTQVLRVRQVNEPYIGLTQENLIESSLQSSLPYIPIHMVHASY